MTLKEFLIQRKRANLGVHDAITNRIRQHVQNIDVLANKRLEEISREDIKGIYIALLLGDQYNHGVFDNQAWNTFLRDARKENVSEEDIMHIYQREQSE